MKTHDLERVTQPPAQPSELVVCECGGFLAEVCVPDLRNPDGNRDLCWVCAHAYVEHNVSPGCSIACGCAHDQIYPADVIQRRRELGILTPAMASSRA